eukprot:1282068-Pleurochrysis_carterae.AAC.1
MRDPELVRRDSRPSAASMPAHSGLRPGRDATAAPVAAIHTEIGACVTAPPRTESSMHVPMVTIPVMRRLAFNSMTPHPFKAIRPVEPDGQVAFQVTRNSSHSLNECTRQIEVGMITSGCWPRWRRIGASISGRPCLRRQASQMCRR